MRNDEKLALVIGLAILTEDRDNDEQRALVDIAASLDKRRNKIAASNPRAATVFVCLGPRGHLIPAIPLDDPRARAIGQGKGIDAGEYSVPEGRHDRSCQCHGSGLLPGEGLSQLAAQVVATWERAE